MKIQFGFKGSKNNTKNDTNIDYEEDDTDINDEEDDTDIDDDSDNEEKETNINENEEDADNCKLVFQKDDVCAKCDKKEKSIFSTILYQNKPKLLKFCSTKCLDNYQPLDD